MRPLLRPALDRFVRNEPGVAAAAPIFSLRVAPPRNVAFVGIWHAERQPIDRRPAFRREMENVFMTIVQVSRRADRFEVSARSDLARFTREGNRLLLPAVISGTLDAPRVTIDAGAAVRRGLRNEVQRRLKDILGTLVPAAQD